MSSSPSTLPSYPLLLSQQQQLCQYVLINQMSNANVRPRTTHPMEESQVEAGDRQTACNIWKLLDRLQTVLSGFPFFDELQSFQDLGSWEVKGRGREQGTGEVPDCVPMGWLPEGPLNQNHWGLASRNLHFKKIIYLFIYLFYGCVGSSFLCEGFL